MKCPQKSTKCLLMSYCAVSSVKLSISLFFNLSIFEQNPKRGPPGRLVSHLVEHMTGYLERQTIFEISLLNNNPAGGRGGGRSTLT